LKKKNNRKEKFTAKSKTGKVGDGQSRGSKKGRKKKRGFIPELLRLRGKNSYFPLR
jgi:hypothetical protein